MPQPILFAEEAGLLQQAIGFVSLLSIAALVAIMIRRIRLPYTVALVLVGLTLSVIPNLIELNVSSDLILVILVPPLLFEATLNIKWEQLKANLRLILVLAIVGTLISTFIVGMIVTRTLNIPIIAAFAFGALISATDPVAVVAFFRSLGVSKRLSILVEGESLFNDGVAFVLFTLAITAATIPNGTLSLSEAVIKFVTVAFGGVGIGLSLGYAVSTLILKRVDDHLIGTATTVALAFGAYVLAEEFHLSGILAVVAAGLMVGNIGIKNASPTTKLTLDNFWEFMAFAVNSLVFLLLGLEIKIVDLLPEIAPIIVAVLAVLFSRAVVIYSLTWILNHTTTGNPISRSYQHVMYWGGLRGAISLALALTLTGSVFGTAVAQELRVMTFGVVLFTLLVQGTTIEKLIRKLGLSQKPPQRIEQQRRQALLYAKSAGKRELDRMGEDGILFRDVWEAMEGVYNQEITSHKASLRAHLQAYPELEQDMFLWARANVLKAERSALSDAVRRGFISEDVYHELIEEADRHIAALSLIKSNQQWRGETLSAHNAGTEVPK